MSYIDTDNYGYSERDLEQNWAAEYAKIVTNELEEKHDEDVAELEAEISGVASDLAAAEAAHAADMSSVQSSLSSVQSSIASEASARQAADAVLSNGLNALMEMHNADKQSLDAEISGVEVALAAAKAEHAADMSSVQSSLSSVQSSISGLVNDIDYETSQRLSKDAEFEAELNDYAEDAAFMSARSKQLTFDLTWDKYSLSLNRQYPSESHLSSSMFECDKNLYINNPNSLKIKLVEYNSQGQGLRELGEGMPPIYNVTPSEGGGYFRIQYYKGASIVDPDDYELVNTLTFRTLTDEYDEELNDKLMPSLTMFPTFGVIGDSYASGVVAINSDFNDKYPQSWGQILAKKTGTKCTNFSHTGLTTRTWLTNEKGLQKLQASPAQHIYYLCLGINDYNDINDVLGTADDIGTDNDTFYGRYSKIVEAIQTKAPNAKIIMFGCTKYRDGAAKVSLVESYNAAIKAIASHYGVPYIDQDEDYFFRSAWCAGQLLAGHPRTYTYASMANAFERLIQRCIYENYSYFADYQITTESSGINGEADETLSLASEDTEGEAYDTDAPVKIGTWTHDGVTSDIYRKAFQIDYDDLDGHDLVNETYATAIDYTDIGIESDIDPDDEVIILDRKCVLKVNGSTTSAGYAVPGYDNGIGLSGNYVFDLSGMPSGISDELETDGGTFYGYIDYIYIPASS